MDNIVVNDLLFAHDIRVYGPSSRDVQDPDLRTRVQQDSAYFEQTGSDPFYSCFIGINFLILLGNWDK